MSEILKIIERLRALPEDHGLEAEDLWEAISRIEEVEKKGSTTTTALRVLEEFVEDVKCAKLPQEEWLDLHLTYRKACKMLGVHASYDD